MTQRPGDILDARFRLDEQVGSGGMAVVYKADDLAAESAVAVKILSGKVAESDPHARAEIRRRFRREADLLRHLDGIPQVPRYVACGETAAGDLWLAMEWVPGRSLRRVVQKMRGRLNAPLFLFFASELAAGLKAIHQKRVLHRDLCPENILIVKDGPRPTLKLIDFGFSKSLEAAAPAFTQGKVLLGKPEYLSPEHAAGEELTAASDVYSLGVILFELLTGRCPIDVHSMAEVKRIRTEAPRPLVAFREAEIIPEALRALITAALAKEPHSRPTVDELLECCRELERRHASGEDLSAAFSNWEKTQTNPGEKVEKKPVLLKGRTVFGPFDVVGPIGVGAMGETWAVKDARTRADSAIRVLREDDPRAERMLEQARIAARFDHRNVMRVYDVGTAEGLAYMAMSHMRVSTLAAELDAAPEGVVPARFLEIATGLLFAVEHVHATAGTAHGAIHPKNVFLDPFDNVTLADFGLGPDVTDFDACESDGVAFGTTAPECIGGRAPDSLSDIYSIGCTLYALYTGQLPFSGAAMRVLFRHCNEAPWSAKAKRPGVGPAGLSSILDQMLEKRPKHRPQSVTEVRRMIDRAFREPDWDPAPQKKASRGFDTAAFLRVFGHKSGL